MNILIVTGYFYPETFKCNDIAFELVKRGHEVTVLTPIPNYPHGRFPKGYGVFKRRSEVINGVKVIRSLIIPRGKGGKIGLVLNYLSYTIFSSIRAFFHGLHHKYDAIFVHEVSPVLVGVPAMIVKKIVKAPMYFWVLDLWPESLTAAGGIQNKRILSFFTKLTRTIYNHSDKILIGSHGYRKSINSLGDYDSKIDYFPNWIDVSLTENQENYKTPTFPKGFNVVIAGNMGVAQDIPNLIEAAGLLKGKGINFIFVGDGRMKDWAETKVREDSLDNVFFMGRFPMEYMPDFFAQSDALLLALKKSPIFELTVPSRIQAYMWAAKPIAAMIDGEGSDLISNIGCGISVPSESPEALAKALLDLSILDKGLLVEMGVKGKKFAAEHFNFNSCMDNLERIMTSETSK